MSAINVNSITGRTGTHGPVLTGVTTATNGLNVTGGSVGIGTDNPGYKLHIGDGTSQANLRLQSGNSDISLLSMVGGTSQTCRIEFGDSGDDDIGKIYYDNSDNSMQFTTNTAERLRITSGGEVQIANGNLKFSTAGTGIDFSATGQAAGMTSELLDDYEEGTWTPTYYGASTAGTYTLTSTQAKYTKIGNTVHLYVDIKNITQSSAGTGLLRIGGLPFQPSNGNEAGSVILEAFSFPSTVEYAVLRTATSNHLSLVGIRNSGVDVQFNVTDRDSNLSDIFGQITYMTSA